MRVALPLCASYEPPVVTCALSAPVFPSGFSSGVAAGVCATVTRYVALRTWVFAHRHRPCAVRRSITAGARAGS